MNHVQSTNPGGLDYIEIGNEFDAPDGRYFYSPIPLYVTTMLNPGYDAIKAADPNIKVLLNGIADSDKTTWLAAAMDAGAGGHFDILSVHSYASGAGALASARTQHNYLASRGYGSVPTWLSEFGSLQYGPNVPDASTKIQTVLTSTEIQAAELYEISDDDVYATPSQICQREPFGLVDHDNKRLKSSYLTWQALQGGGAWTSVDDGTTGTSQQQIRYQGSWLASGVANDGRFGGTTHYSNTAGSTATMTFTGKRVQLFANISGGGGRATVTVDGGTATTIDTYSAQYKTGRVVFDSGILSNGTHTVVVTALGTANAASTNRWIDLDRFIVVSGSPAIEDDIITGSSQDAWSYSTGWASATGQGDGRYAGTSHWSNTAGSTATLTFVGTGYDLRTNKSAGGGRATVSLDGGTAVTIDTYQPTYTADASVRTVSGLPYGAHTIVITALGTATAGSTNSWVDLDRLITF